MLQIITDSTADLSEDMIKEYAIEVIPLNVIIDGQNYADGVELSREQFYAFLTAKKFPSTSQPSPSLLKDRFQAILDRGDDVFYVGVSSVFSGTVQAAGIAREMTSSPERVTVYDSLTVAIGQGMLACLAARWYREGDSVQHLTARLDQVRRRQKIVFSAGGLDYLHRSGRVNNLSFLFGSLLNIKPILTIDHESVVGVYERARGKKNADLALYRFVQEFPPDPNFFFGIAHTNEPHKAAEVEAELRQLGIVDIVKSELCGVIGTHTGPGTIGLVYVAQK